MSFQKILYIGAGLHLDPLTHFSDVKRFVFIDSRPRNEYGYDYYYRGFYRFSFLPELYGKLNKMNFMLNNKVVLTDNYSEILMDYLDTTYLDWKNIAFPMDEINPQELRYYYSTGIPNDLYPNEILQKDINTCDTILICGHHPHKSVLDFIQKPFHLICYSSTYYPKNMEELIKEDPEDQKTIISHILQNPDDVKDYTLVKEDGTMNKYKTYEEFYLHLKS